MMNCAANCMFSHQLSSHLLFTSFVQNEWQRLEREYSKQKFGAQKKIIHRGKSQICLFTTDFLSMLNLHRHMTLCSTLLAAVHNIIIVHQGPHNFEKSTESILYLLIQKLNTSCSIEGHWHTVIDSKIQCQDTQTKFMFTFYV